MSIDDAVQQVRQGDREAYRHVIASCEAKVRVVVAAILPELGMIDDVVQEVLVHAYQRLEEYRLGTDFLAWIKEIARNLALNERRGWVRRQAATRRHKAEVEDLLEHDLTRFAERCESDALESIRDCVSRLQDTARDVVERHYWQGMSGNSIAQALGRTTEWVKIVLFRARGSLVECLHAKGILHGS
jgi:RNA polymerase sigma-70 factor (ECF subfamily)